MADGDFTPKQGVLALDFEATKRCRMCGEEKPLSNFAKRKEARDGRDGRCRECYNAEKAAWQKANPDKAKASTNAWRSVNRERVRATMAAWRLANPDKVSAHNRSYHERYPEKTREAASRWAKQNPEKAKAAATVLRRSDPEKHNARSRAWQRANPEKAKAQAKRWSAANGSKIRGYCIARRTATKKRTPGWLNPAHFTEMDGYYQFCRIFAATGPWHVDHRYPVRGKAVSGLHVPWNLAILSEPENVEKHNKMPDADTIPAYIERPTLVIAEDGTASLAWP